MVLLWALAAFASTLAGGAFAFYHRERLMAVMSLSAGMLIGVVFLELVPEIFHRAAGTEPRGLMIALLAGFIAIFLLEKLTIIHGERDHDQPDHHHHVGAVGAAGLAFHSLLDGLAIGSGFQAGETIGLGVLAAVLAHDFADGLNTVTFMLATKSRTGLAVAFLLLDAAAPVLGAFLATHIAIPPEFLAYQLAFFAGFLLYMGASDLLPHVHQRPKIGLVALTLAGIAISSGLVSLLEHVH